MIEPKLNTPPDSWWGIINKMKRKTFFILILTLASVYACNDCNTVSCERFDLEFLSPPAVGSSDTIYFYNTLNDTLAFQFGIWGVTGAYECEECGDEICECESFAVNESLDIDALKFTYKITIYVPEESRNAEYGISISELGENLGVVNLYTHFFRINPPTQSSLIEIIDEVSIDGNKLRNVLYSRLNEDAIPEASIEMTEIWFDYNEGLVQWKDRATDQIWKKIIE